MRWEWMNVLGLAILTLGAPMISRADLVSNGGFETGNFNNWTLGGNSSFGVFVCATGSVFQTSVCTTTAGNYAAALGPPSSTATLSQILATTVGTQYTLSFDLRNDNVGQPAANSFAASWGGTTLFSETNAPTSNYVHESFNVSGSQANTTLQFTFYNNPGGFYLDNVSVVPGTVPEPSTVSMVGMLLFAGVLGRRYTRRQGAADQA